MHDMTRRDARCDTNAVRGGTGEGGNIRESIPGVSHFRTDEPEVKCCRFTMLGTRDGRTSCVSGIVSSF